MLKSRFFYWLFRERKQLKSTPVPGKNRYNISNKLAIYGTIERGGFLF